MGFIVSAIWLHLITPIQTTTLIVGYRAGPANLHRTISGVSA